MIDIARKELAITNIPVGSMVTIQVDCLDGRKPFQTKEFVMEDKKLAVIENRESRTIKPYTG